MQPDSFDADLGLDWSRWVLAHGLPDLPGTGLADGESVPVSYWVGPRTAAVLHIRRIRSDGDGEWPTETDIDLFCLVDSTWTTCGGGGGSWKDDSPLTRIELPPTHASLAGMTSGWAAGRGCTALFGEVGTEVATAEVRQAGRVTRRPVLAPVGAFVVCADYAEPFTVRVLDPRGQLLAEFHEPAGID